MAEKFEEKDFTEEGFNFQIWIKMAKLFRPFMGFLAIQALLQILMALIDVLIPYLNKEAIDTYTSTSAALDSLWGFIIFYVVIILITGVLNLLYFRVCGKTEMGFGGDLRDKCFHKLQSLSFSYFDTTPTGWLMARMTSDISRLAEILAWSLTELAWGIPVMIFSGFVMFTTNVNMTLIVLAVAPILAILSYYFQIRQLKAYRQVRKANSKITNDFNEGINGAKTTKTLNLEEHNFNEFKQDTAEMKRVSIKAVHLGATFRPLVQFISSIAIAAIIWIGGDLANSGLIGFGTLMMFIQYAQQFYEPVRMVAMLLSEFQMAQASGERIVYLLESEPTIVDSDEVIAKYGTIFDPKPENYESIKGDIEFKDVDFSYIEGEKVLENFNLKINAGDTIALVGETGSGKSTIVNLICRFYEPVSGELLIDGTDYRERSIGWLHSKLGYVLQAPHLFSGTIKENVRFSRLDATDEEIIEACKLVNAHDFIMSFEDGYDTDVGEGGSRLSTGQKQLISFARAVLADPAIFVLDEATSSIDTETEKIIQYAIENIMKEKTSFVVAHRLSTIVNADRILVIKNGKIIEDGKHNELLKLHGYYYRLYTNQFNEDLKAKLLA